MAVEASTPVPAVAEPHEPRDRHPLVRAARGAVRGAVAAMAMSGTRRVSTRLGLLQLVPPEEVLEQQAPGVLRRVPQEHVDVAVELLHWGYGAAGGAAFGLLPAPVRGARLAGPLYGLGVWVVFEVVVAPLLGLRREAHEDLRSRLMLAADHVLYGVVVAGQLAPEPAQEARQAGEVGEAASA